MNKLNNFNVFGAIENECMNYETKISMVGDICIPEMPFENNDKIISLQLENLFLAPFEKSDLILCNFEAPLSCDAQTRENKKYNLSNSSVLLNILDKRFVLSLANNHMMDFGEAGLRSTIEKLKTKGLNFAGAGMNIEEASKPAIVECKGVRIAVICAADPRFQPADKDTPGTLPARSEILTPIIQYVHKTVDMVVMSIHAGMEFTAVPTPFMIGLADQCLKAGAHIVKYHHAHCLSGYTSRNDGLILWGVGNYTFPYIIPRGFSPWFQSAVWNILVEDKLSLMGEIVPIQINKKGVPCIAQGDQAISIKKKIEKFSFKINKGKMMGIWRLASVFDPVYLWLGINNYAGMVRRTGLKSVIKQILSTFFLYSKKHANRN